MVPIKKGMKNQEEADTIHDETAHNSTGTPIGMGLKLWAYLKL